MGANDNPSLARMNLSIQAGPRYLQVAGVLRNELATYPCGSYLPSEAQLAERFNVNRHTVRRAIDVLAQEGRVLRHKGRGTCVLSQPIVYPLSSASAYSRTFSALGLQTEARLLKRQERAATDDEARRLALADGERLIELTTLRLLDGEPISLIAHCFGARHGEAVRDYRGGSLRAHLADQDIVLKRTDTWIGARSPATDVALRLLMPRNSPVLTIQTLSSDNTGQPFELSSSVSRADRFTYHVHSGEENDD